MNANIVQTLSRHAARSVTRRGSLLTLGSALVTTVAAPSLALAGKSKKKTKRKSRKNATQKAEDQANQVCASQVAGCRSAILAGCSASTSTCLAAAECCSSLSVCNTTEFFSCLVTVSS